MPSENRSADAKLLRDFSSGSKEGFAAFYERFAGVLFSTTSRILGDGKAAEDALQEAFVHMWKRSAQFDASQATVFAWAVMIARNEAVRRLRTSGQLIVSRAATAEKSPSRNPAQTDAASSLPMQEQSRVCAALAFLTRDEREALELCFFEGLTASQVAGKLGIPPGELGATVQRGLFGFLHALSNTTAAPRNGSVEKEATVLGLATDAA